VAVASGGRRCRSAKAAKKQMGRRRQPKKNAIVLSFKTGDASHEKLSLGAEAGREKRSRQQQ